MKQYEKKFNLKEVSKGDFKTTGIQNIDDERSGLSLLRGGNSIGYIEVDDFRIAGKIESELKQIFNKLNNLKNKFNLDINLEIYN